MRESRTQKRANRQGDRRRVAGPGARFIPGETATVLGIVPVNWQKVASVVPVTWLGTSKVPRPYQSGDFCMGYLLTLSILSTSRADRMASSQRMLLGSSNLYAQRVAGGLSAQDNLASLTQA